MRNIKICENCENCVCEIDTWIPSFIGRLFGERNIMNADYLCEHDIRGMTLFLSTEKEKYKMLDIPKQCNYRMEQLALSQKGKVEDAN